jgi:hypothetical protein
MYRVEDYNKIIENAENIKDNSYREYKENYEPTLQEIAKVYKSIIKFIKKNNLLVYGGFAQNTLIKNKNPKDVFYKEIDGVYYNWPDVADIEIYSPTPIEDVIKLTEYLFAENFKYIDSKEAPHGGTYKIFVNFLPYVDITYMPYNIYNNIMKITIDDINLVHPNFMFCDSLRILTDPYTSYWRLDKTINRFQKILTYYPIDVSQNNKKIDFKIEINNDILDFIRHKIIHDSQLIIVGFYAFNYYVKKYSDKYLLKEFPYYELISTNYINDNKNILNILKKEYGNKITTKEFYTFFDFLDERTEYYYNKRKILVIYGSYERCIVYNQSDNKKVLFGTFNLVLMYMFFVYVLKYINKDQHYTNIYYIMIGILYHVRNSYLTKHKITVLDASPFKDFTFKCLGQHKDLKRDAFLQKDSKFKRKKLVTWRYTPTGKPAGKINYIFPNVSGNEILKKNKNKK